MIFVTPDIVGPVKNGGIGTACFHYARVLAGAGIAVEILFAGWELDAEDLTALERSMPPAEASAFDHEAQSE